jgi:hypothetical protein
MKQTKKIRLVIEADVQQDTELTPEVVARIWGSYNNYPEMISSDWAPDAIGDNQALLSALLADPAYYQRFLFGALRHAVTELTSEYGGKFHQLAGLSEPGLEDKLLEEVIEDLPAEAQDHFQDAQNAGVLWENTELTRYSIQVAFTRVSIEEAN